MLKIICRSLLIFITLQISPAFSQSLTWQVSEISGDVSISTSGGPPQKMSSKHTFTLGQTITTGKNGAIALTKGQQGVVLSANSQLEIPSDKSVNNQKSTTFFQALGSIIFSAKKRSKRHFKVQTPFAAAIVKGTTFAIHVSKSNFDIQVFEGSVELKGHNRNEKHIMLPGTKATLTRNFSQKVEVVKDLKQRVDNSHFGNDTNKIRKHYSEQLLIINKSVTIERKTNQGNNTPSKRVTVTHTKESKGNSSKVNNSSASSSNNPNSHSNSSNKENNRSNSSSANNNNSKSSSTSNNSNSKSSSTSNNSSSKSSSASDNSSSKSSSSSNNSNSKSSSTSNNSSSKSSSASNNGNSKSSSASNNSNSKSSSAGNNSSPKSSSTSNNSSSKSSSTSNNSNSKSSSASNNSSNSKSASASSNSSANASPASNNGNSKSASASSNSSANASPANNNGNSKPASASSNSDNSSSNSSSSSHAKGHSK